MFQGPSDCGLPECTHNVDMDMSFRELMVSALAGVSRPQNISSSHSTQESSIFSSSTDHNTSRGHHSMALDLILGPISLVSSGMTGTQNMSSPLSPQFENDFSFTKSLSQSLVQEVAGCNCGTQHMSFGQQPQGCPMHLAFRNPSQQEDPFIPMTPSTPNMHGNMSTYSKRSVHAQSIGQSMHDYSLGYTPCQPAQTPLHDPGNQYIQSSSSSLNPTHVLAEEIKKINIKLVELQVAHKQLALHVENNEMVVGSLTFATQPILHKKVLEICGMDMLGQADCLKTLAQYQHGLPDQWPSEESMFTSSIALWMELWKMRRQSLQAKGELDDNDYVSTTVMMMAKSYWRMLASDIHAMADPQGQAKRKDQISDKCHRSRWGQIAHHRRGAMEEFEKKFGVQGAAAMIDSDFGSDNQTIDEELLSEDMNM
ncbi:hypothetical protein EDC04DRAFT_2612690 [Pisolithus marmoratus]|nr:hypothetical protein EDC04DRAFT_2612690 [Pisolithus marmoratus]